MAAMSGPKGGPPTRYAFPPHEHTLWWHDQTDQVEEEKYSEGKAKLRQELFSLREKVMTLITTNEQLPAIEQLERREFILDTEEHKRLQAEEDAFIQKVWLCLFDCVV